MAALSELVDFGTRYKGKPVSEMLKDTGYMEWLKQNQPKRWEKYSQYYGINVVNIVNNNVVAVDQPTPAHNLLQIKFLSEEFVVKYLDHVVDLSRKKRQLEDDFRRAFDCLLQEAPEWIRDRFVVPDTIVKEKNPVRFELNEGWDVFVRLEFELRKQVTFTTQVKVEEYPELMAQIDEDMRQVLDSSYVEFHTVEEKATEQFFSSQVPVSLKESWTERIGIGGRDSYDRVMAEKGKKAAEIAKIMKAYPNIRDIMKPRYFWASVEKVVEREINRVWRDKVLSNGDNQIRRIHRVACLRRQVHDRNGSGW